MTKCSQGACLVEVATTVGNASLTILQLGLGAIYSVLWWAVESTICVTDWVDDINNLKGETTVVTLVNPLFTSKLGFRGGLCWPSSQSSIVLRILAKVEV